MALARSAAAVYLTTGFFTLSSSLFGPAVLALISKRSTLKHGLTMGLSNAAMSLGRIAGPLWGGLALDWHLELPYLSGAGVMLTGFLMGLIRFRDRQASSWRKARPQT